ncbi:MAG: DMT family transporter [Candidatus Thermoplasmatota archaeon]|nr:DMT family transporter [Candidatus Thermoplasmatota archaeon]
MKDESYGMVLIGITVFLWSTIEVVTKLANSSLPPLTIAFLRFILGGLFLLPLVFIYWKRVEWARIRGRDWTQLVLISFLGITCTFALYHLALTWIDVSSVATLVSMVPLFSAPISYVVLKEKIGYVASTGLVMGAVGVLLIFLSEERSQRAMVAVSIMCIAVVCFTLYAVLMKPLNKKMDARVTTPLSLIIGGVLFIPILLLDGAPLYRPMDLETGLQVGYLSFIAVGVAYLFYFMGLHRVKVAMGNSLLYLKPLLATILAFIVLSDHPSAVRIAAILVITVSVYLVIRGDRIQERFLDKD